MLTCPKNAIVGKASEMTMPTVVTMLTSAATKSSASIRVSPRRASRLSSELGGAGGRAATSVVDIRGRSTAAELAELGLQLSLLLVGQPHVLRLGHDLVDVLDVEVH